MLYLANHHNVRLETSAVSAVGKLGTRGTSKAAKVRWERTPAVSYRPRMS